MILRQRIMKGREYFWVYIIECDNGAYYTGYTDDLARRYYLHLKGLSGSKYTRSFKPVRLAQCWRIFSTKGDAMKVERLIKKIGRKRKESIIDRPGILLEIVSEHLQASINIKPFDPAKIEEESKKIHGNSK